jgi:hypothetical protein
MVRRRTSAALLLLALALLTGCGGNEASLDRTAPRLTTVEVTNKNVQTVRIDAVSLGSVHRLGLVDTMETRRFRLPKHVSPTSLRIRVDPVGGRGGYTSPELRWSPGDVIDVDVLASLDMTQVYAR